MAKKIEGELIERKDTTVEPPFYYVGSNGYKAIHVVQGFQPENYNLGTAISYLLRAGKKKYVKDCAKLSTIADCEKAIAHLKHEIQRQKGL